MFSAFRRSGATALARRLRPGAVLLCYHNVVDGDVALPDPALHIARGRFAQQMDWLAARFTVLPLAELMRRAARGDSLRGLAAVTFDDAYVGTLTHGLDELRRRAVPSTVFVPTAAVTSQTPFWWDTEAGAGAARDHASRDELLEQLAGDATQILARQSASLTAPLPPQCLPAGWEQLRSLDSTLVALESHTVNHRTLPRLNDQDLVSELRGSADTMERELGRRPSWIAYPYGRWDARVARQALASGYTGGFALDGRDVTPRSALGSLPRLNIPAGISLDAFAAWVSGVAHWRA